MTIIVPTQRSNQQKEKNLIKKNKVEEKEPLERDEKRYKHFK